MKNCLLCGVGGQGTVLASRILAAAAIDKGLFARTAETIGMSQRGGCVVSHVRIGDYVPSPMIPAGKADVLVGFEPGEAVRNLNYLKPNGIVIVCDRAIKPVSAAIGDLKYSGDDMIEYLKAHIEHCYVLDAAGICEKCGSDKVMNVALVGALAATGAMELNAEDIDKVLTARIKPGFLEMNKQALSLGAQCV